MKFETEPGAIVQLSPEDCGNPMFGGMAVWIIP